jgi:hypothetical protein
LTSSSRVSLSLGIPVDPRGHRCGVGSRRVSGSMPNGVAYCAICGALSLERRKVFSQFQNSMLRNVTRILGLGMVHKPMMLLYYWPTWHAMTHHIFHASLLYRACTVVNYYRTVMWRRTMNQEESSSDTKPKSAVEIRARPARVYLRTHRC